MSVICQLTLVSDFFGAGRVQYRLLGMKAGTEGGPTPLGWASLLGSWALFIGLGYVQSSVVSVRGVRKDLIALTLVSHPPSFRDRVGDFPFPLVGEEPSVDSEFITNLRTHHRICTFEDDEPKYELVVPGPEDRWVSFRAIQGRRLFTLFDESFHDFKNYFFKVQAVEGHHPFFLDDHSSPRFPLYWLEASPCEKYGLDDLNEVEAAIVGFLREAWGRAPYFDTKKFLQGSPTFVQSQLEMAKKNAQESYQRVQEAKAKSRARSGGVRTVVSPPPPPRNVGTPSQPIVISSSASSLPPPPVRPTPEPEPKKRKTLESGASGEADALAFVRKNIYPHARMSMDDVSVRHYLTTVVEESLKTAGVCGKLLDIFEKTPISSLGTTSRVEELEGRLRIYQEHEKELEGKVAKLTEERDSLREKGKNLQAQCNMEMDLRKAAQASYNSLFADLVSVKNDLLNAREAYTELEDSIADGADEAWRIFKEQVGVIAPDLDLSPLDPDKIVIDGAIVDPPVPIVESESDLKTRGQRIIESPPHSKDAPSSSTVPPTSSSTPAPGVPPDSAGSDLLKK
ncbi:uncharacterized protein DS421_14g476760 [Arachis hypogaea]|nr:uncharacterized protein DS421_14g476760 [Arachis hypogaea]